MLTNYKVDRESRQKLYVQMFSIIKDKIEKREWHAGSQIPTEDELCRCYDVSKATVRMAIADLVRSGYLKKQQGKGTFVLNDMPDLGVTMKTRLTEDIFGEGVNARKELIEKGFMTPPEGVNYYLKTDAEVFYILCKRVVDNEPAYLEESYIPSEMMDGIEALEVCQSPFFDLIQERAAKKIYKVVQMIEVAHASNDAASILKTAQDSPVILLHRLLVAADSSPIAYTRLMGSGKKYKLRTELLKLP